MSKGIIFRNHQNEKIYPCPYYPVGSIFLAVNNINPSSFFGGTWEQIKDRFLLCAGSIYKAGNTGGEATHTLTVAEMPSHNHEAVSTSGSDRGLALYPFSMITQNYRLADANVIRPTGGNQPHNNMPPYLVVYAWKRVL
jgi:hypothetical protein